jgi:hypothetical protein
MRFPMSCASPGKCVTIHILAIQMRASARRCLCCCSLTQPEAKLAQLRRLGRSLGNCSPAGCICSSADVCADVEVGLFHPLARTSGRFNDSSEWRQHRLNNVLQCAPYLHAGITRTHYLHHAGLCRMSNRHMHASCTHCCNWQPTEHSKLHLAGLALTHMQLYPTTAEHYASAACRKERVAPNRCARSSAPGEQRVNVPREQRLNR